MIGSRGVSCSLRVHIFSISTNSQARPRTEVSHQSPCCSQLSNFDKCFQTLNFVFGFQFKVLGAGATFFKLKMVDWQFVSMKNVLNSPKFLEFGWQQRCHFWSVCYEFPPTSKDFDNFYQIWTSKVRKPPWICSVLADVLRCILCNKIDSTEPICILYTDRQKKQKEKRNKSISRDTESEQKGVRKKNGLKIFSITLNFMAALARNAMQILH